MKDDLEFSSQDTFEDGGAVGVDRSKHPRTNSWPVLKIHLFILMNYML